MCLDLFFCSVYPGSDRSWWLTENVTDFIITFAFEVVQHDHLTIFTWELAVEGFQRL